LNAALKEDLLFKADIEGNSIYSIRKYSALVHAADIIPARGYSFTKSLNDLPNFLIDQLRKLVRRKPKLGGEE
jgi:hypothetical protein